MDTENLKGSEFRVDLDAHKHESIEPRMRIWFGLLPCAERAAGGPLHFGGLSFHSECEEVSIGQSGETIRNTLPGIVASLSEKQIQKAVAEIKRTVLRIANAPRSVDNEVLEDVGDNAPPARCRIPVRVHSDEELTKRREAGIHGEVPFRTWDGDLAAADCVYIVARQERSQELPPSLAETGLPEWPKPAIKTRAEKRGA